MTKSQPDLCLCTPTVCGWGLFNSVLNVLCICIVCLCHGVEGKVWLSHMYRNISSSISHGPRVTVHRLVCHLALRTEMSWGAEATLVMAVTSDVNFGSLPLICSMVLSSDHGFFQVIAERCHITSQQSWRTLWKRQTGDPAKHDGGVAHCLTGCAVVDEC